MDSPTSITNSSPAMHKSHSHSTILQKRTHCLSGAAPNNMLKEKFTTAPILTYPDNDCKFCLECDSSDFAIGVVLSIFKDDKWHLVAYTSHSMSLEEWNYPIADKEMLSMIWSLEMWHHYLKGAKQEFKIWNDHVNLQWFMK